MKRFLAAVLVFSLVVPFLAVGLPDSAFAAYTPPALKVAFVRSTATQAWVDSYHRGYGVLYKEDALYNYLVRAGWDVTSISDADLENIDTLRQYDVVVLMWVFAMSPNAANTVVRYVGEGGGVVVPYASPRVAPGVGGSETGDHWVRIMNYEGWEWGPLSEVYQTMFIDDVGALKYVARPTWGDPIVTGASSILQSRGLDASDMSLWRNQNPGSWIEYVRPLTGNVNAVKFMSLSQLTAPNVSNNYNMSNGPGAVRSNYLKGRSAYFYFSPTDFIINQDGSGNQTLPTGVRQSDIAGAYIESAIVWAAGTGGRPGALIRDGKTYATINVSSSGIYANHYIANTGNVTVTGTLYFRVWDPSGRLVKQAVRYKIGREPGSTYRYSQSYTTSRLASGRYRVEFEYATTYPKYERRYVEFANVYRSQGTGIPTSRDYVKTTGPFVVDPRITRSAGINRYSTSLAIADAAGGYPRAGGYVVIAGGDGPDALAASSIAGSYDAPLILTDATTLSAATDLWLQAPARGFQKAIIVGGRGAVSDAVQARLEEIFGAADVTRIAGDDRYSTAAAVAVALKERLGSAYDGGMIVTNGSALVDAAGASAIAYGRRWPILYVGRDEIPTSTADAMAQLTSGVRSPSAWIAGGTGVVGDGVSADIASRGVTVQRAAGTDRYDTGARFADLATASGSTWSLLGIASGVNLADALCLGSYVGRTDGVILLTNGQSLPTPSATRIRAHKSEIVTVTVGGGFGAVADDACAAILNLLP
ncbi:MAG: hypothetical protein FD171_610 [Actinobacteria bacterium]|nr:MAG: hypothetical protein FD171_610 [Actinomycetota bacterium]MDO8948912.1 cell wall-binding repeat-containing protein [Actinomycetota bacterium]